MLFLRSGATTVDEEKVEITRETRRKKKGSAHAPTRAYFQELVRRERVQAGRERRNHHPFRGALPVGQRHSVGVQVHFNRVATVQIAQGRELRLGVVNCLDVDKEEEAEENAARSVSIVTIMEMLRKL